MSINFRIGPGDGNTTDSLDLMDFTNYLVLAWSAPRPTADTPYERTVTLQLHIQGTSADNYRANKRAIDSLLNLAYERYGAFGPTNSLVTLSVQLNTTEWVYFDIKMGLLERVDAEDLIPVRGVYTLTLTCLPYARGDAITVQNLITYPITFGNAAWTKTRSSITNDSVTAPDGSVNGDKLVEDSTASNTHGITQAVTLTAATQYTVSCYAKQGERTWLKLLGWTTASVGCTFDLANGLVGTADAGVTGAIESVDENGTSGWYRCSITFTYTSGASTVGLLLATGTSTTSYSGNGTSGVYVWGYQVNAGADAGPLMVNGSETQTLTNGQNAWTYVFKLPGDAPGLGRLTLSDVSSSGVINGMHIGWKSMRKMAMTDFSFALDLTAAAGATATTDGTTYLGSDFARITPTGTWTDVASASKPSATYALGLYDCYLRMRDASSSSSPPQNLSSAAFTSYPDIRQNPVSSFTGTTATKTATFTSTPLAGNQLIAVFFWRGGGATAPVPTVTAGWTLRNSNSSNVNGTGCYIYDKLSDGTETGFSVTPDIAATGFLVAAEIWGIAVSSALDKTSTPGSFSSTTSISLGASGTLGQAFELAIYAIVTTSATNQISGGTGMTGELFASSSSNDGGLCAYGVRTSTGTFTPTATSNTSASGLYCYVTYKFGLFGAGSSSTNDLAADDYTVCVAAIVGGSPTAATPITTLTVLANGGIALTWDAPDSGTPTDYRLYWRRGTTWNYRNTGTTYRVAVLFTENGATTTTTPNFDGDLTTSVKLRASLSSGTTFYESGPIRCKIGGSIWEFTYAGTIPLPPAIANDGSTPPNWKLTVQVISTSQTPQNFDVDAAFLFPVEQPQVNTTYDGQALATKRDLVIDTRRDYLTSYRLYQTGTSTDAGQVEGEGCLLWNPGDLMLLFHATIAAGASEVSATQFKPSYRYVPRYYDVTGVA